MSPAWRRGLWLWGTLLASVVTLVFLPFTVLTRGTVLFIILLICVVGMIRSHRRPEAVVAERLLSGLPPVTYRQPVVLVCGDALEEMFGGGVVQQTAQGCWLKVEHSLTLRDFTRQLLWLRPEWASQLAIMVVVNPQQQMDQSALSAWLYERRWQVSQLRRTLRRQVPLLLVSRVAAQPVVTALWQAELPGDTVKVWLPERAPCTVPVWISQGEVATQETRLQQQIIINALADWVHTAVLPSLTGDGADIPPVLPCAIALYQSAVLKNDSEGSLWLHHLQAKTSLVQVRGWQPDRLSPPSLSLLPDYLLPFLPTGSGVTPRQRALSQGILFFALTAMVALCSSGWQNSQLLHRLAFDIQHYYRIAMTDYTPKAKAVAVLQKDAAQLDEWFRSGEPIRLGLGLYQGERMLQPILSAITTYIPPPEPAPEPDKALNIVRLDSLALFDVGKSELKPGSTKVLVNALVNIKARPGWLIMVAGHTDDTGDNIANQQLSLKRADAVRDWMLQTSDVSATCFAVQGYGESRPIKNNDTAQGRAANRRVEISLVPQADACQAKGESRTSSAKDEGLTQKMEK